MIRLRHDCLVFETAQGEYIPCSAEAITIELMGDAVEVLDPEMVKNAAQAVLHYFKNELGQASVSAVEFSQALEKTLRGLGLDVKPMASTKPAAPGPESDLRRLAGPSEGSGELFFFPRLRDELRRQLGQSPRVVRFHGLRGCVRQITGAKRWTGHCQNLRDQIVEYLRVCLRRENNREPCALIVL